MIERKYVVAFMGPFRGPQGYQGNDFYGVIGPFDTKDAANQYVKDSQTYLPTRIVTLLKPVTPPDDDADLNP